MPFDFIVRPTLKPLYLATNTAQQIWRSVLRMILQDLFSGIGLASKLYLGTLSFPCNICLLPTTAALSRLFRNETSEVHEFKRSQGAIF